MSKTTASLYKVDCMDKSIFQSKNMLIFLCSNYDSFFESKLQYYLDLVHLIEFSEIISKDTNNQLKNDKFFINIRKK